MFQKLFTVLIFLFLFILGALLIKWPEEFAEQLLPGLAIGAVVVFLFLSWYLGYFTASQKPPVIFIIIIVFALIITFASGLYVGRR
jgi:hypothetical protein